MNESLREQRPLLCEEYSDEEIRTTHYCPQRKFQHSFRGRARNKVKGAAAIISHWPDYWSSSVLFWWIVVGMFLLLIMVIYNTIVALVLIPSAYTLPFASESNGAPRDTRLAVNMHVFIEENEIVDLKHYLPFINKLTDNYQNFKYNFIVLLNDSATSVTKNNLEEHNAYAMNDILSGNEITGREVDKVGVLNIKHVLLSEYLDFSPVKKRWRTMPAQFLPLLVRAVSIWENGGIAFDPLILTPHTPNSIYAEKLQDVMRSFAKPKLIISNKITKKKVIKPEHNENTKKRINNIQDIINNGKNDNDLDLSEAENRNIDVTKAEKYFQRSKRANKVLENPDEMKEIATASEQARYKEGQNALANETKIKKDTDGYRAMIVSPNDKGKRLIYDENSYFTESTEKLIVDLKGNFLATKTGCHAFIGTIFNNFVHQISNENVTDFIINNLSKFCKGVLTSCNGIDVILV